MKKTPHISYHHRLSFEERAAELYRRLYIARSVAERIRDSSGEDRNTLRSYYEGYKSWEYTAAALSSGYREHDRIIATGNATNAVRVLSGDYSNTLSIFRETQDSQTSVTTNAMNLPCRATLQPCGSDAADILEAIDHAHHRTFGTVFFLLDVDEHNAEAASTVLRQAIRSRMPLLMAVCIRTPVRQSISPLTKTISRHGGAYIDMASHPYPKKIINDIYRLNTYLRAEQMQALITFSYNNTARASVISHERCPSHDMLGYLARVIPDYTRRSIIYETYTHMHDIAS